MELTDNLFTICTLVVCSMSFEVCFIPFLRFVEMQFFVTSCMELRRSRKNLHLMHRFEIMMDEVMLCSEFALHSCIL